MLARKGYYDNTSFHRLIPGFMIQVGQLFLALVLNYSPLTLLIHTSVGYFREVILLDPAKGEKAIGENLLEVSD